MKNSTYSERKSGGTAVITNGVDLSLWCKHGCLSLKMCQIKINVQIKSRTNRAAAGVLDWPDFCQHVADN